MKLDVLKLDGSKAGSVELDDAIFGVAPRADILHRVVRYQLAKRRAGTHDTQNRGEVSRTHSKFGKQKGSGGARHGSRNAPIFRGGGVAHGPHPRSHAHSLNKKVRALGMTPSETSGSPFKIYPRKTHAHKKLDGSEAGSRFGWYLCLVFPIQNMSP
jgi:ribosomal protein L4